ncbi:T6SS immunity protein Tli4 family protein [Niveibacterium sp.]|uniref:T6SS immunity protein Tli4 family protein n=1 Tax=Niveibacterium sp. TaxID=2017444 RepID=UPI0035AEFF6A
MTQSTYRLALALIATVSLFHSALAQAKETLGTWQRECVGRFSLELPGEVDVAMPDYQSLLSAGGLYNIPYTFPGEALPEGQTWGDKQIAGFQLESGPLADATVFAAASKDMDARYAADIREERATGVADPSHMKQIESEFPDTHTWAIGPGKHHLMRRGGRLFSLRERATDDGAYTPWARHVSATVRSRKVFEVPAEPGLCLHYGFLPDGGNLRRDIGVTYRLKEHPEIEIFFQDMSAGPPAGNRDLTAAQEVQKFWEFRHADPSDRQVRLLSPHMPGLKQFPDVVIANYEGKRSFVEITRQNGSLDYGYMAFVKGDSNAKEDKPDLLLYVIRNAERARGTPLNRNEVEAIANHIAASVRRR